MSRWPTWASLAALSLVSLAATLALTGSSCKEANPAFCDDATMPCLQAGTVCYLHKCETPAQIPADAGVDLAGIDLSVADGPARDLAGACTTSPQCPDSAPICDATLHTCRACMATTDDTQCGVHSAGASPRCDGATGQCVACLLSAMQDPDCTAAATPVCAGNQCRACMANSECTSQVCDDDGTCAGQADVVYVDNQDGACKVGPHAGTLADPDCDLATALKVNNVATIHVAGRMTAYLPLDLTMPMTVRIVGPGATATPTAKIAGNMGPAINLNVGGGGTTSFVFDGVEIHGDGNANNDAVDCSQPGGPTTLTIRHSLVDNAKKAGINSNGCTVAVTQSTITSNTGGGVTLSGGTTYDLRNDFIFGNPGVGITISGGSTGTFSFNTLAFNGPLNQSGGVVCDPTMTDVLRDSIIWGNSTKSNTQFTPAGQCQLVNIVAGASETYDGATKKDPDFVSAVMPYDVHLVKDQNLACCVDKITPPDAGAGSLPTVDHDGNHRPQGNGWDIGAHEVQ